MPDSSIGNQAGSDANKPNDQTDDLNNDAGLDTGGDSSTTQDANKPKDMESAVRRALDGDKGEQSSSSGDNGVGGQAADPSKAAAPAGAQKPADDDSDLTEAEINSLKPRTRRSFERMRGQLSTLENEVQQFKPAAEKLANIQGFCIDAGLTSEDVNSGFNIMKAMKTDPAKAFELLTPLYDQLKTLVGEVLPRDLQQQVVEGRITPEYAQEMSRLRARSALTERRMTQTTEQQQQQEQKRSVELAANAAGSAVSDLEKQWAASDPDYRVKSTRIAERIELELLKAAQTGKLPRNAQEAVEIAKRVKTEVDNEFKRFLPQKRQVQTVMGVQTSTGSKPAPKNLKEAIQQSVGQ